MEELSLKKEEMADMIEKQRQTFNVEKRKFD